MAQAHYFTGECKWAQVHKEDNFGKYSIQVKLEGEELDNFKALGLKNQAKDGWVTFRRDPSGVAWVDGKQVKANGPKVVDENGDPFTEDIGNGSTVTVKIITYDYNNKFGKGKGSRMEGVCVEKHVKYDKSNGSAIPENRVF